jgi:DNA mismatch repair ATPase MutS
MMEQFIEIKANNPDSLLFYRMGDFYELFFEDAIDASRALGITLTKRGQHLGQDIPMCGVPVHAADDYLQKLISLGFRVAVCEQTEDPAEAKKRGSKSVVRRDVTRLVTPGTLTEEKLLDPSQSNFLMALARVKGCGRSAVRAGLDRHFHRRVPCRRKPAGAAAGRHCPGRAARTDPGRECVPRPGAPAADRPARPGCGTPAGGAV